MANVRDLKVRIKAVGNIRQITRAMEMVATTKLRRFQTRAEASGPYTKEIEQLVGRLASHVGGGGGQPLFEKRPVKKLGLLIVSSDRGLCGAYNTNTLLEADRFEKSLPEGVEVKRYVIGKKAMSWCARRKLDVEAYFEDPILEQMGYRDAARIAQLFEKQFVEAELDEVWISYTRFVSMTKYVPSVIRFLPLGGTEDEQADGTETGNADGTETGNADSGSKGGASVDLILEPSPEAIFGQLVPKYLETRMFNALLESLTSEYASRRVSMKNATDAANDMVGELKRVYNRARQERITKELLEIVGGAEAVSG